MHPNKTRTRQEHQETGGVVRRWQETDIALWQTNKIVLANETHPLRSEFDPHTRTDTHTLTLTIVLNYPYVTI